MQTTFIRLTVAALLTSGFCVIQAADSPAPSKRAEVQTALAGLSLSEAVKSSASLVSAASETDRKSVASAVLQVMARSRANSLPQVVGVISAEVPDLAGFVTAEAVWMRPDQAAAITKNAVKASPEQAAAIVESVLVENPSSCQVVGVAAMDAAPAKSRDILSAISLTSLDLKDNINQALAGSGAAAKSGISATDGKKILLQGIKVSKNPVTYQSSDLTGGQVAKNTSNYGAVVPAAKRALKKNNSDSADVALSGNAPAYGAVIPASIPASRMNGSGYGTVNTATSVAMLTGQTASSGSSPSAPTFMPAPTFTPPPVPIPVTPINIGVNSGTVTEPTGGRNYSAP
jgi:hypothetical protein